MSYRLSFTGGASAEIDHLLTAIEHRLNGHVAMSIAAEDLPAAATEMTVTKCTNGLPPPCPGNDPHGPWVVVAHGPTLFVGALVLAFAAGFGVATMLVVNKLKGR